MNSLAWYKHWRRMRFGVKLMNFVLDILCLKSIHPSTWHVLSPHYMPDPLWGAGMQKGSCRWICTCLTVIQRVKCYEIVNKKSYGWHSVGIGGMELRVKLEPKGQMEIYAQGKRCTKGVQETGKSEWGASSHGPHCGRKAHPRVRGPWVGYASGLPSGGAALDKGTVLAGHSGGVKESEMHKWMAGATLLGPGLET